MTSEDKPRNPNWGGKRPGAGAPKGNLNALKHGRRSRQFAEIGAVLAEHPDVRGALLHAARRRNKQNARAEEIAADLIIRLFQNAGDVAAGRDSPGPFRQMIRSSEQPRRLSAAQSSHRRAILTETLAQIAAATQPTDEFQPNNQPSPQQTTPEHEIPHD